MEEKLTIEQMLKRSADARKVAKELERWLRNTQDLEKRKSLARLINICYTQAKKWRNEAKRCQAMAEKWPKSWSAGCRMSRNLKHGKISPG